jgi:pyruvate formate lyase activating enzyme
MVVRTPVVAGVNATAGAIGQIADFLSTLGHLLYYELLPYNPLGAAKYEGLGEECPGEQFARPGPQTMRALTEEARRRGIPVRCPDGDTDLPDTWQAGKRKVE